MRIITHNSLQQNQQNGRLSRGLLRSWKAPDMKRCAATALQNLRYSLGVRQYAIASGAQSATLRSLSTYQHVTVLVEKLSRCRSVVYRTEYLSPANGGFKALNPIQQTSALGTLATTTNGGCPVSEIMKLACPGAGLRGLRVMLHSCRPPCNRHRQEWARHVTNERQFAGTQKKRLSDATAPAARRFETGPNGRAIGVDLQRYRVNIQPASILLIQ